MSKWCIDAFQQLQSLRRLFIGHDVYDEAERDAFDQLESSVIAAIDSDNYAETD